MEKRGAIAYPAHHGAGDGRSMGNGITALTEREKETLRLLLAGHDAKSIARHLGLSVHTINERLRDARRKLGVSGSREAARLLAGAEGTPDFVTDRISGVAGAGGEVASSGGPGARPEAAQGAAHRLAWFGGGMIVMSLLVAAVALSSAFHGPAPAAASAAPAPATTTSSDRSAAAGLGAAEGWLGLLDAGNWEGSWRTAAPLFTAQITAAQWTATIRPVRQPLGRVSSRTFQAVTRATALPGAPAGEYEVIQFRTDFAARRGAVETVTLSRDRSGWRVAGYFIR